MGKMYTRSQTQTAQKKKPFGAAHIYMAYMREYPLGPYQGNKTARPSRKVLVT